MKKIEISHPGKTEVEKLNLETWSPWECDPDTFDWEYSDRETAYVFEGLVRVKTPYEEVEIKGGDLVIFPKGLKCIWTVIEKIRKVYKFG